MAIKRYENLTVNNLTFTKDGFGEQSTTQTAWFVTRGLVSEVANSLKISDKYRVYQDLINFDLNYTANTKEISENTHAYSFYYRNHDWRITDARQSNDRMTIKFLCYRTDPITAV